MTAVQAVASAPLDFCIFLLQILKTDHVDILSITIYNSF